MYVWGRGKRILVPPPKKKKKKTPYSLCKYSWLQWHSDQGARFNRGGFLGEG